MAASSPWLDQWAPAQWILGRPTSTPDDGLSGSVNMPAQNPSTFDTTLHWKISGTIIVALIIIFGLQAMGFRFVVAANTSIGVGR